MKITLSRNELAAALLFASTDDTRFSITGIHLEWRKGHAPTVVATDGRRLVAIQSTADQEHDQEVDFTTCTLRDDFLKPLCALSKGIGGALFPWMTFQIKDGSKRVLVELVGKPLHLELEDGGLIETDYPAWRKVLPAKNEARVPVSDVALNAVFIGDFAKAGKLLGSENPVAQFSIVGKESAMEVRLPGLPDFYGMIMQCRLDDGMEYQPEFVAVTTMFPEPVQESKEGPEAE